MNKILRLSVSLIIACLFLGALLYIAGVSSQAAASADQGIKILVGKELSK